MQAPHLFTFVCLFTAKRYHDQGRQEHPGHHLKNIIEGQGQRLCGYFGAEQTFRHQ